MPKKISKAVASAKQQDSKRSLEQESQALQAISPLDGRYADRVKQLRALLSEYGLIHHRLEIEVAWLVYCIKTPELTTPAISAAQLQQIKAIVTNFSQEDCLLIKQLEIECNHDVKAVERFLRQRLAEIIHNPKDSECLSRLREWVHFACTSEDINNLAYALMVKRTSEQVLTTHYQALLQVLKTLASTSATSAMLAYTHGQAASPTTMGKELNVFAYRLESAYNNIRSIPILGKFNGAVGNYNAHKIAYPNINWPQLSKEFVNSLGLAWNPMTTQIEPHDWMATFFDAQKRANSIMLDLCKDVWSYIALGYLTQKPLAHEVGSSAMPHKINPIDFENAEGNLGIANSLLSHLAQKLPISRWQRDLSDSTAMRNIGVAIAHSTLAMGSIKRGLEKITVNSAHMQGDLEQQWMVLTEAIQVVMRRNGLDDAYEQLRVFARGQVINKEKLQEFIKKLAIPEQDKKDLLDLKPEHYIGLASELAGLQATTDATE